MGRTATKHATEVEVDEMSVAAARSMFDARAHDALGIGREEFLKRLDAGEYEGTDSEDVITLGILAPFGR